MHLLCIYEPLEPKIQSVIMLSLFNIDVYGEKQLLFYTSILEIVDHGESNC